MATEPTAPGGVSLPQVPIPLEPPIMKVTRGHSCVLCQQRKVRCDKNKPCSNCIKAGVDCRVVPPQPPRRRKKKLSERELIDRVRRYESLLAENGIDFDASGVPPPGPTDEVAELECELHGLKTSPSSEGAERRLSQISEEKCIKLFPFHSEFKASEELMVDSSDDDYIEGSTIHQAYDKIFDHMDGFPFVVAGQTVDITDRHPSAVHIFQLWQIYLNNVNPLLKVTHTPTLQGKIIEATASLGTIAKGMEALMFGIYFMAILSLSEEECLGTFNEDRRALLGKYHAATQQALINASFMRTSDIMVLQAYLLYLLAIRYYVDPRSLFCLIGIGIRICHRLGIHRDGAQFNLPPFETEMRRRLWWQFVVIDKRVGEMTGSAITAIATGGDTKLPLNINDADLHLNAKDPPTPHNGPTEMLFALTRLELVKAVSTESLAASPPKDSVAQGNQAGVTAPASSPAAARGLGSFREEIHASFQTQRPKRGFDVFCEYMEETYLRHCDPKVPIHLFTILMTRGALWKMRVIHFMCDDAEARRKVFGATGGKPANSPQNMMDLATSMVPGDGQGPPGQPGMWPEIGDRDRAILTAVKTIETDNTLHSTPQIKGYVWYALMNFPFPSYMFLVHELRRLTTGDLCARAWKAISNNHEKRKSTLTFRNPMHLAIGHLFIKAWDARGLVASQQGEKLEEPDFVRKLRDHVKRQGNRTVASAESRQGFGAAGGFMFGVGGHGSTGANADNTPSNSTAGNTGSAPVSEINLTPSSSSQDHQPGFSSTEPTTPLDVAVGPPAPSFGVGMGPLGMGTPAMNMSVDSPPGGGIMEGFDMFGGADGIGMGLGMGQIFPGGEFGDLMDWSYFGEFGGGNQGTGGNSRGCWM